MRPIAATVPHHLPSALASAPVIAALNLPARVPPREVFGTPAAGLSLAVCLVLWSRLRTAPAPLLFKAHVACVAPALFLVSSGATAVRRRVAHPPELKPKERRPRSEAFVISRDFLLSASAMYLSAGGVAAIFANKARKGAVHFATLHGRIGLAALCLMTAAYLAAQPNVWRDVLRSRRFVYKPRWLWASSTHRRLGVLGFAACSAAVFTGLGSGWSRGALGVGVAAATAAPRWSSSPRSSSRRRPPSAAAGRGGSRETRTRFCRFGFVKNS